jgi:hypothetical protein
LMETLGEALARLGFILRSGGAEGADSAFEKGAMRGMDGLFEPWPEIYLPWPNFNGRPDGPDHVSPSTEALNVAAQYHPAWDRLSPGGKLLHGRNTHQVLGSECDWPSEFLVCWTPRGKGGGGTGQALRLAAAFHVPAYDLAIPEIESLFRERMNEL